jgi:predicted dehydrogenase
VTRVAIVGAGVMGANHARVLATIRSAEVVAVVEPDPANGRSLARSIGVPLRPLDGLAEVADAAIVASPSQTHAEIGEQLLADGLDLLIEKPLATTVADARRLVTAARAHDRIVMVGHIERFNAAVLGLPEVVSDPVHIEFTRVGPYTPRITSDVVLDLMVHDLDLARMLAGSPFVGMSAIGRSVHSGQTDLACALLTAESGLTVSLTASRAGQTKVRRIEVTQRDSFVVADLLRQDIKIHRLSHNEYLSEGGSRYRESGVVEIPYLERTGEPLRTELEHFLDAVRGHVRPAVDSGDGLEALRLALEIGETIEKAW